MQVRPSRGHGSIVSASLSKTALKKANEDIDSKISKGMTWEEAGKALEPSLDGIEYASKHDVLALLQKMASKGLRLGTDEAMEKEAQHWLGRGLNWLGDTAKGIGQGVGDAVRDMGDTAKGIGQGIGDAAKGVGDWAKARMDAANQWQQLQPKLQAIRQSLDMIERNPNSLRQMWPSLVNNIRALAPAPAPAQNAQPKPQPAAVPQAPAAGPFGVKTLPMPPQA